MTGSGTPDEAHPTRPPRALRVARTLVVAEAVVLAAAAAWSVVDLVRGVVGNPATAVFLALFALGVAWVLVAAVRALLRGSRRARGPVVTWQLLQAATGVTVLGVRDTPALLPWFAGVAIAVAAAVVVAVLTPAAVRHTLDEGGHDG